MALVEFQNNTAPYINANNLNNNFNYLDGKNDYSTDEIVIGKWKNNKPIYRKCFSGTYTSLTERSTIVLINDNIESIIDVKGSYSPNSVTPNLSVLSSIMIGTGGEQNAIDAYFGIRTQNNQLQALQSSTSYNGQTGSYDICVEYTKVVD